MEIPETQIRSKEDLVDLTSVSIELAIQYPVHCTVQVDAHLNTNDDYEDVMEKAQLCHAMTSHIGKAIDAGHESPMITFEFWRLRPPGSKKLRIKQKYLVEIQTDEDQKEPWLLISEAH